MRHFLRRLPVSNAPLDPPKPLTGVAHPRSPLCKVEGEVGLEQKFRKISKKLKISNFATSSNFDATSPAGFLGKSYASSGPLTRPVNTLHLARALPLRGLGEFESYVAEKNNTTLWKKRLKSPPALRQCGADSSMFDDKNSSRVEQ